MRHFSVTLRCGPDMNWQTSKRLSAVDMELAVDWMTRLGVIDTVVDISLSDRPSQVLFYRTYGLSAGHFKIGPGLWATGHDAIVPYKTLEDERFCYYDLESDFHKPLQKMVHELAELQTRIASRRHAIR